MSAHHESPFFSPRRFARLARLQWQEQGRAWGMFALVLAVLLVLVAGLMLSGDGRGATTGVQVPVYLAGLLLSGYLFAHQVLGVWRSREASLLYLMRHGIRAYLGHAREKELREEAAADWPA